MQYLRYLFYLWGEILMLFILSKMYLGYTLSQKITK